VTPEELKGMNGRRVLVELYIRDDAPDSGLNVFLAEDPDEQSDESRFLVSASAIREILPEPIKAGDRVKWRTGDVAEVLAVHDGRAWVLYESGARDDWPLSDLTLVEPGQ
jgi:hypothetical protein